MVNSLVSHSDSIECIGLAPRYCDLFLYNFLSQVRVFRKEIMIYESIYTVKRITKCLRRVTKLLRTLKLVQNVIDTFFSVSLINVLIFEILNCSSPWAATGGMDQKLIIWDPQQSTPRSTCQHEVY